MKTLSPLTKIFKFIPSTFDRTDSDGSVEQGVGEAIKKGGTGAGLISTPQIAIPAGNGIIDIVDDFRWTKSDKKSIARKGTPKITLTELQVVNPSFFNNFHLLLDQLGGNNTNAGFFSILKDSFDQNRTDRGDDTVNRLGLESSDQAGIWNWIKRNIQAGLENAEAGSKRLQLDFKELQQNINKVDEFSVPQYLKFYQNLYGVNKTKFTYRLPYLEDGFKQINNSWSADDEASGFISSNVARVAALTKGMVPSVGVDYSKSFQYPSDGPSHTVTFYLDNTLQSGHESTKNSIADNINFVYLLLYQNLPSRVNRTSVKPPVIYQAFLPGVFSYRWSFLSNISINFVGTRRRSRVVIGGKLTEAVIPEGYEIQMTINSLTPETQNLMYNSIDTVVTSGEERNDNN